MKAKLISAFCLAALLSACMTAPDQAASSPGARAELRRALALARLSVTDRALESTLSLTPANPRDGSAALSAAAAVLWDPLDGNTGSIAIKGKPDGSPYDGGHGGLSWDAKAGLTYLAYCKLALAGGSWDYNFSGVATGGGNWQPQTPELVMPSIKIPVKGRVILTFASRQTGHKLLGCTVYGLRT